MSEQNAGTQGPTERDRKVKDLLDRVAAGTLSSEEAAILLAATAPEPQPAPQTASQTAPESEAEPVAEEAAGDVWAEAVAAASVDTAQPEAADKTETAAKADAADKAEVADKAERPQDEPAAKTETAEKAETAEAAGAVEDELEVEHSHLPAPAGVQRVTIRAIGRRVRLTGEPAINGVAVDGPHQIKRDGDTLAINSEGDMGVSLDGFTMLRTRSVGDLKSHMNGFAKELQIRVNPSLRVEVEVTGGSVVAERLPNLAKVRVTAGTAKVTDVDGPIDLLVQAGSATLDAQITKGRSRVRVESGAATVNLRRGSDVKVHTEAQLGKVSWTGAVNGQSQDVEIGRGRASLDVEVLVGTAQIASD
ncbi:hypothetical protein OG394_35110 [Kribbella sp. NBC_01245]|uniref:hypothetical protein n=1 Tax=Kribbella sp. NBC_01245 TaxID=2903578 RepID=UPI002E2E86FF|nr:hypothetical protein [Kribbella sp. NBC_01245]